MQVERMQPGRNDFEVRNIAANGKVWTGVGTNTRNYHPRISPHTGPETGRVSH